MRKGTFVKFAYFVLIGITIILWAVLTVYDIHYAATNDDVFGGNLTGFFNFIIVLPLLIAEVISFRTVYSLLVEQGKWRGLSRILNWLSAVLSAIVIIGYAVLGVYYCFVSHFIPYSFYIYVFWGWVILANVMVEIWRVVKKSKASE